MITVAVIEDIEDIREAIHQFLNWEADFSCVGSFGSFEAFLKAAPSMPVPDIILTDIGLPGMSGLEGIPLIEKHFPQADIIMLTVYQDYETIYKALCAGAVGYLLKNTPMQRIADALRDVKNGGSYMSPQIARMVMNRFSVPVQKIKDPLTEKERQIVDGLIDGLSYKLIADRLGNSVDTINFHIKNIYKKLSVNSRGEILAKAARREI